MSAAWEFWSVWKIVQRVFNSPFKYRSKPCQNLRFTEFECVLFFAKNAKTLKYDFPSTNAPKWGFLKIAYPTMVLGALGSTADRLVDRKRVS